MKFSSTLSPDELYQAVTDAQRLARRWTIDARGESAIGKGLGFFRAAEIEVTTLQPGKQMQRRVVDGGAADRIGTEGEFRIFRDQERTFLHFRYSKWLEDATTFPYCSMGWGRFSAELKEFVETEKIRPHPYDMPVNLWSPPTGAAV